MLNSNDLELFLSDPLYGYRDEIGRPAPMETFLSDFRPLADIANKIENTQDPYEAARKAVRLANRYRKQKLLHPEMSVISTTSFPDGVVSNHKFRALERRVLHAQEQPPNFDILCCTPKCGAVAIKRSHVVQRNKILSTIVDSQNSVLQTKIHPDEDTDFLKKVGWKNASTFPGFCQDCETKKFGEAEKPDAEITRENVGKLLWRALCFSRYRRAVEVKERALIVSKVEAYDVAKDLDSPFIPFNSALIMKTRISAFQILDSWVKTFEKAVFGQSKRFGYYVLELENSPFVGAGAIPIYYDTMKKPVVSPRKFDISANYLSYTSFSVQGKQFVVFGYDKSHKHAVTFIGQLKGLDYQLLSAFLPQLIIANSDTVYLSPTWWDEETDKLDRHIVLHGVFMNFAQMVFPWWGPIKGVNVIDSYEI